MLTSRSPLSAPEEETVSRTIGCGIEVHRSLGPGFRERIYQKAFQLELESRGLRFECEKPIEVIYKKWKIPDQRIDLVVEDVVIVELKTVSRIKTLHRRQLVSYLRSSGLKVGLLMNFNTTILKNGIARVVCETTVENPSSRSS